MTPTLPIHTGQPLLLFTDLDGTLIDHHSYSAENARAAVGQLVKRGVPLVFCSSKTFAEQIHLQRELGIRQPFIVENGSAVAIPRGYFSGAPLPPDAKYELIPLVRTDTSAIGAALAHFQDIKRYSNASDLELSAATGLSGDALTRARDRSFTETLLTPLTPETVAFMRPQLESQGLTLSRGGRFFTVQSAETDKGRAVRWLAEIFGQHWSATPLIAACGDSANDASMLTAADIAFLVQRPDHTWMNMDIPGLIRIEAPGPVGFSRAVWMLLG